MEFSDLVGQTLTSIDVGENKDEIIFTTTDKKYLMWHDQDCCESVRIDDICGELSDLIGVPIITAEESSNNTPPEPDDDDEWSDSQTWTFYRIATKNGLVVIRWYGSSNGYYSESVNFEEYHG